MKEFTLGLIHKTGGRSDRGGQGSMRCDKVKQLQRRDPLLGE